MAKKQLGETKTVMEWLYEMKLYKQKIEKCKETLSATPLFYAKPTIMKNAEEEEKIIKSAQSLLDKFNSFVKNYETIKQAILEFNATTKIEINGTSYSIARALELDKKDVNNDFLSKYFSSQYGSLQSEKNKLSDLQTREVSQLESKLLSGLAANKNDSKIQSQLDSRRQEYLPYILEAIDIGAQWQELTESRVEFKNQVNAQINIANVTNKLTIILV